MKGDAVKKVSSRKNVAERCAIPSPDEPSRHLGLADVPPTAAQKQAAQARKEYIANDVANLRRELEKSNITYDELIGLVATCMSAISRLLESKQAAERDLNKMREPILASVVYQDKPEKIIEILREMEADGNMNATALLKIGKAHGSVNGIKANDARHKRNRDLNETICKIWANGKFSSRDVCAEEEYSSLGFGSQKKARNALINTPDPSPWPGKKIKSS